MIPLYHYLFLATRSCLIFILLASGGMSLVAQVPEYSWGNVQIGGGGYVTGIAIHPLDKDRVYIRTDVGGAYRWDAKKRHWEQMLNWIGPEDNNLIGVDGIALDRNKPDRVYLALGRRIEEEGGVYRSEDRGLTWSKLLSAYYEGNGREARWTGECIAIDPLNSNIIYAGTRKNGLWLSTDDGLKWRKIPDVTDGYTGIRPTGVRTIVFDPAQKTGDHSSTLFAGVPGTGVYCSRDGGTTFSLLPGSPKNPARMQVVNSELFVTHSTGVALFSKGKWNDVTPVSGKNYVGLAVDETDSRKIIAAQRYGTFYNPIYRSVDKGKTWEHVNGKERPFKLHIDIPWWPENRFSSATAGMAFAPGGKGELWYTDWFGSWVSPDIWADTTHWYTPETGHEETVVLTLNAPPGGALLYSGVADVFGFRHDKTDAYPKGKLYNLKECFSIAVCEKQPSDIAVLGAKSWEGDQTQLATSPDAGNTWTARTLPPGTKLGIISISAVNPDRMVYISGSGKAYYSHDRGDSWEACRNVPENIISVERIWSKDEILATDLVDGSFYILAEGTLYSSPDGATWTAKGKIPINILNRNTKCIATAPGKQGEVWICLEKQGLWKTSDGGKNFNHVIALDTAKLISWGAPAPGISSPTAWCYGTMGGKWGLYRSVDLGTSWIRVNDDQHRFPGGVKALAGDRNRFGRVFIGSGGCGVYYGEPVKAVNTYSKLYLCSTDSVSKYWGTKETELIPEEWKAFWIWRKGESAGTDLILDARKRFSLKKQPEEARLYITADNNYELFVNGIFVNRGPARCQPHHQSYDILDIASLLKAGENVLAMRVLHQGKFGSYNTPPRPGLLAQLEIRTDGKMQIIKSDSSWKMKKPEENNLSSPIYGELVDFRKEEKGWREVSFNDNGWAGAEELVSDKFWPWPEPSPEAVPKSITFPWETLVPRDLPYLTESLVMGKNLVETGEIMELGFNNVIAEGANGLIFPDNKKSPDGLDKYQRGEGPLVIRNSYPSGMYSNDAIYSTYLIFDLGEVMHGYTHLELEGSPGTIVDVLYSTHLLRGKFPMRSNISGRSLTDRIILSGGKTVWDAMEMKYMRYLFIAIRNTDQPVKLFFSGLKKADYPFETKGSFSVNNDNELEWLWKAASNTLRSVTTDAFTDNYRERLQYAQTSYYAARCSYAAFGDSYLQRRYLKQIAQEQQNDGILPASAPITGYRGQRFLDGSIFWIMGLHDYLLHSGDTITTNELLPVAEKILERFRAWENKEGFIDSPPYPYWIDHAAIDRYGANFSLNALYLLALQNFATMSGWLGNHDTAQEYEKRIEKLRINMRTEFWDPDQKLFSDTWNGKEISSKFSEQSNSLAIVGGIATQEQQREILKEFVENKSGRLVPAVLFMHYLAESLFLTGNGEQALSILKERYRHMRTEDSATLWEEWALTVSKRSGKFEPENGRCNAQGEQTFLSYSLTRWLLGIMPTRPGMTEVELSCNLSGLHEIKGSMPSPKGTISVAWKEIKNGISLEVEIPRGIRATINRNSLNLKKKIFSIDGKSSKPWRSNPEIPAGRHILEFY